EDPLRASPPGARDGADPVLTSRPFGIDVPAPLAARARVRRAHGERVLLFGDGAHPAAPHPGDERVPDDGAGLVHRAGPASARGAAFAVEIAAAVARPGLPERDGCLFDERLPRRDGGAHATLGRRARIAGAWPLQSLTGGWGPGTMPAMSGS